MSHFHIERRRAAVAVYNYASQFAAEAIPNGLSPLRLAQIASGGASPSSIYSWRNQDLSVEAYEDGPETRGRHPVLSDDQESLLVGFACHTRSCLLPVDLEGLTRFCRSHLSETPSTSTLSRIMKKHGLSSQTTMERNSRMVSEDVVEEALATIEKIRDYDYPPNRILSMDESGLWSNVRQRQTYHFKNWYGSLTSLKISSFP